jgi:glycosyltransferase involved in cell wall biosynthesis
MKDLIKRTFRKVGIEISRYNPNGRNAKFASLKTKGKYKGDMLLSFTVNPFLLKEGEAFTTSHIVDWECFQVAKIFLDLGYSVDVIDFNNINFVPKKDYSILLDVSYNLDIMATYLKKDCIKILYPKFGHWLSHNAANYSRYLALRQRKGITLKPLRLLKPNLAVEHSDYIILRGAEFSRNSYGYGRKPTFHVNQGTITLFPWPENKNYETSRKNFLFLGGSDLVHKGLDLVLEAFAEMPKYHLYICASLEREKDFEKAFYKELYETSNIHTIGWMDITSSEFIQLMNKCLCLVNPSCSEMSCGSVRDCMQGGLIPIISYESDVDVHDFGIILGSSSVDEIRNAVKLISDRPAEELKSMSRRSWEFARETYTKEKFIEEFKSAVLKILGRNEGEVE